MEKYYVIESCSGGKYNGRYPERFYDEDTVFVEAIKRSGSSKLDLYITEISNNKEIQIARVYHHFIDDLGYYNPIHVRDFRTGDTYDIVHKVSHYCQNISPHYW